MKGENEKWSRFIIASIVTILINKRKNVVDSLKQSRKEIMIGVVNLKQLIQ